MSTIIPKQCNFIIIGAWNPAIIQPVWLKSQFPDMIKGEQFGIELETGPVSSFRYDVNNIFISPNSDRLTFIPKEINCDTLSFISKLSISIYKKLSHTPVLAAGCNFVYKLEDNEVFCINNFEQPEKLSEFYENIELKELTSQQIRHKFSFSNHNLNISYNSQGDERTVHYNFDYHLGNNKKNINKATESLNDHYNFSIDLNSKLIRGK